MLTYLIVLLLISFFSKAVNNTQRDIQNPSIMLNNRLALTIMISLLVFLSGVRYHVGADFNNYVRLYANRRLLSLGQIITGIFHLEEAGYNLICYVSAKICDSYVTMFFLTSMLTIIPSLLTIYKKSNWYWLSMVLYILLVWDGTFGAIRQCLAAATVFAGFSYIEKRNFLKYAILVGFAMLFHTSAFIMLPAYFVLTRKASLKNTFLMLGGSLILRFSYDAIFGIIGAYKGGEIGDYSYITSSVNVFRILVAFAPCLLLFFLDLRKMEPTLNLSVNFIVFHAALMFATSNSTYLARAAIFTSVFLVISIPEVLLHISRRYRKLIMTIMVACYIGYWLYGIKAQRLEYHWIFSNI